MTFFESPPPRDDSWRWADDPFSRLRREERRKRIVTVSVVAAAIIACAATGVVAIGPEKVTTAVTGLFAAAPPDADLVAVADKALLTEEGRELLYSSTPRLATLDEIGDMCGDGAIGCYHRFLGISIHQPNDARVADLAVTTLAHELLHAAYDELAPIEAADVDDLLHAELTRIPAEDPIHTQIAGSVGDHAESLETELFAYLGSQVNLDGGFAPELEAVYAQYFTDRFALAGIYGRIQGMITTVYDEVVAAQDALVAAEAANVAERAQIEVDRAAHEVARQQYTRDADQYNAIPLAERGGWSVTWTRPDGTSATAPLGDSLATRWTELEAFRVSLEGRATALEAGASANETRRLEVDAQLTDLRALLVAAFPEQAPG